jgi:hypothetical protein
VLEVRLVKVARVVVHNVKQVIIVQNVHHIKQNVRVVNIVVLVRANVLTVLLVAVANLRLQAQRYVMLVTLVLSELVFVQSVQLDLLVWKDQSHPAFVLLENLVKVDKNTVLSVPAETFVYLVQLNQFSVQPALIVQQDQINVSYALQDRTVLLDL